MADAIDPKTAWKTPFGMALLDFAVVTDEGGKGDAERRLRARGGQSQIFLGLLLMSTTRFVFKMPSSSRMDAIIHDRPLPPFIDVDSDGFVAGTGRRAIGMISSYDGSYSRKFPDPDNPHEASDLIVLQRKELYGDDVDLNEFVATAAHEMQHSLSTLQPNADNEGKVTLLAEANNFFDGESEARTTEKAVYRQLGDRRGSTVSGARTIAEQIRFINNGTSKASVTRSFRSGPRHQTYAELALKNHLGRLRDKAFSSIELHGFELDIDRVLVQPVVNLEDKDNSKLALDELASSLRSPADYREALATSDFFKTQSAAKIYGEAAVLHLIERVFDRRWEKFLKELADPADYFIELEKIEREHIALLLALVPDAGCTVDELLGPPAQTTALTQG